MHTPTLVQLLASGLIAASAAAGFTGLETRAISLRFAGALVAAAAVPAAHAAPAVVAEARLEKPVSAKSKGHRKHHHGTHSHTHTGTGHHHHHAQKTEDRTAHGSKPIFTDLATKVENLPIEPTGNAGPLTWNFKRETMLEDFQVNNGVKQEYNTTFKHLPTGHGPARIGRLHPSKVHSGSPNPPQLPTDVGIGLGLNVAENIPMALASLGSKISSTVEEKLDEVGIQAPEAIDNGAIPTPPMPTATGHKGNHTHGMGQHSGKHHRTRHGTHHPQHTSPAQFRGHGLKRPGATSIPHLSQLESESALAKRQGGGAPDYSGENGGKYGGKKGGQHSDKHQDKEHGHSHDSGQSQAQPADSERESGATPAKSLPDAEEDAASAPGTNSAEDVKKRDSLSDLWHNVKSFFKRDPRNGVSSSSKSKPKTTAKASVKETEVAKTTAKKTTSEEAKTTQKTRSEEAKTTAKTISTEKAAATTTPATTPATSSKTSEKLSSTSEAPEETNSKSGNDIWGKINTALSVGGEIETVINGVTEMLSATATEDISAVSTDTAGTEFAEAPASATDVAASVAVSSGIAAPASASASFNSAAYASTSSQVGDAPVASPTADTEDTVPGAGAGVGAGAGAGAGAGVGAVAGAGVGAGVGAA